MTEPWAVLVVPAAGDPGGLLANGVLGATPPFVWRHVHKDGSTCWDPRCQRAWLATDRQHALPLWWDGALVPEGWARFVYSEDALSPYGLPRARRTFRMWPDLDTVLASAFAAERAGLASRVVLLDLIDGRLVERGGSDGA